MSSARRAPGAAVAHPVVLAAIAVLVLNDHWGKATAPGFVTGKLSDFAGMVFFPVFLQAALEVIEAHGRARWAPSPRLLAGCVVATGVVFSLVKLSPWANAAYAVGLGALQWPFRACLALAQGGLLPPVHAVKLARDATDMLALPMLAVAYQVGSSRCRR